MLVHNRHNMSQILQLWLLAVTAVQCSSIAPGCFDAVCSVQSDLHAIRGNLKSCYPSRSHCHTNCHFALDMSNAARAKVCFQRDSYLAS
jgi:hypothetical protein